MCGFRLSRLDRETSRPTGAISSGRGRLPCILQAFAVEREPLQGDHGIEIEDASGLEQLQRLVGWQHQDPDVLALVVEAMDAARGAAVDPPTEQRQGFGAAARRGRGPATQWPPSSSDIFVFISLLYFLFIIICMFLLLCLIRALDGITCFFKRASYYSSKSSYCYHL